MDEVKGLARLVPWTMRGSRCDIFRCNQPAEYMLRHKQGMFNGTDTHFLLCGECAEAMLRELPEELRALLSPKEVVRTEEEEFKAFQRQATFALLQDLIASPEIQALGRGEDAPEDIRVALGSLLDLLAEAGAEVTVDEPAPVDTGIYCPVCEKGPFKTQNGLTGHMRTHRPKKGRGK